MSSFDMFFVLSILMIVPQFQDVSRVTPCSSYDTLMKPWVRSICLSFDYVLFVYAWYMIHVFAMLNLYMNFLARIRYRSCLLVDLFTLIGWLNLLMLRDGLGLLVCRLPWLMWQVVGGKGSSKFMTFMIMFILCFTLDLCSGWFIVYKKFFSYLLLIP